MKRLISRSLIMVVFLSSLSLSVAGQIFDPVTWTFTYEKKGSGSYELVFTAEIEEGSYLYAMDVPNGGPIPTSFSFDTVPEFSFDGSVYQVTVPKEKYDEAFGFNIRTFSGKAEF
ncbi:MAG: hypothetical protein JXR66_04105, partial [Bacteroidales bacterium]|nr:hypothetical protein [Bacteroidales bacterium]